MLTVDPNQSRIVIETRAMGLLASIAHDLRIAAPIREGMSADGQSWTVLFDVAEMRVTESARHGTGVWHAPKASDAADIEGRIRRELFAGCPVVSVKGQLADARVTLAVRAQREQTVGIPVSIERSGRTARATGRCELSLASLGTGKVRVPLGAIKLADPVTITFDVLFVELGE
jgi:hypothetical protein